MDCQAVRLSMLSYQRGQLDPAAREEIRGHLATCADCSREDAAERGLTEALEERLPQHAAPLALKRRLASQWRAEPAAGSLRPSPWRRWWPAAAAASAVAAALLIAWPLSRSGESAMVAEAVNDHLRMVTSRNPLDVESGGIHEVKPWFEGRLDFAPVVPFDGDQDFPLHGGAVGYFLDRKAAIFSFSRRLHAITLIVFRADGLSLPGSLSDVSSRGFNVILWRRGELGYALVSDVDRRELSQLAVKLSHGS